MIDRAPAAVPSLVLPGTVRGSERYEQRRRGSVWQRIVPHRFPASIVALESEQDAIDAVLAARRAGRRVAVISSGHSYIGAGLHDDAVLLDLRRLHRIDVAPGGAAAHVGPGATNGRVEAALAAVDRAFPVGHSPSVAIGGYLLGGGLGWNPDGWGIAACARVVGATVLLASGEVVRTSAEEHPDLFFALRGAGPCFPGAVLDLEVATVARPRAIVEVAADLPLDDVDAIAGWASRRMRDKAPEIELSVTFHASASGPTMTVTAVAFSTDAPAADAALRPLLETLPVRAEVRRSVRTLSAMLADNDAPPQRYAVGGVWSDEPVEVLRRCAARFRSSPSVDCVIHVSLRSRPDPPDGTAFSIAGSTFVFSSAVWDEAAEDEANLDWQSGLDEDLASVTVGYYVNETDYLRHRGRLQSCFSSDAWARIERTQVQYDPARVFAAPN